jgi:hypothetical protein
MACVKIQRARPEIPVQIPVISKMLMRQEYHVPAAILCRCRPVKKDRCTMSLARSVIPCAAIFVVIALAGCQKQTVSAAPDPQKSLCDQAAASALAGKNRISDQQAMQQTGATLVRQIKPGDPVTMDFHQERVTIETDPDSGRIVRAACG